jgi:hypothetical protein
MLQSGKNSAILRGVPSGCARHSFRSTVLQDYRARTWAAGPAGMSGSPRCTVSHPHATSGGSCTLKVVLRRPSTGFRPETGTA